MPSLQGKLIVTTKGIIMAVAEKQVVVEREGRSPATIVGIIVVILLVLAALYYGLPYVTGGGSSTTNVNVNPAPTTGTSGQ